ncbi:MAG TPA: hypothetical protein PLK42_11090 [Casimicrobium sp.]|nr:hypothetical protein [Casimicrobium sp.]
MTRAVQFAIICFWLLAFGLGRADSWELDGAEFDPLMAKLAEAVENCNIVKAYTEARYVEAFSRADSCARAGNPNASYWVGRMYFEGKGVEQNFAEGIRQLQIADSAGDGQASRLLAAAFVTGQGVEKSLARAREFEIRGFRAIGAFARFTAKQYAPGLLGHKWGDELPYRFWTQFARFNLRFARQLSSAPNQSSEDKTEFSAGRLPEQCRPPAPPRAMNALKVDKVEGYVSVFMKEGGKADVVAAHDLSDRRLTPYAFDVFDKALRSEKCVLPILQTDRRVVIPFMFKLE